MSEFKEDVQKDTEQQQLNEMSEFKEAAQKDTEQEQLNDDLLEKKPVMIVYRKYLRTRLDGES